jgi:hypothetical protein
MKVDKNSNQVIPLRGRLLRSLTFYAPCMPFLYTNFAPTLRRRDEKRVGGRLRIGLSYMSFHYA